MSAEFTDVEPMTKSSMENGNFSQMEMAVLRSAGIDPSSITYSVFISQSVFILMKSFEAIYRLQLPSKARDGTEAEGAAVLVNALRSNLLQSYPDLHIISAESLIKKDLYVMNVVLTTLFQEGQRLWLERLRRARISTSPSAFPRDIVSTEPHDKCFDGMIGDGDPPESSSEDGQSPQSETLPPRRKVVTNGKRRKSRRPHALLSAPHQRRNFVTENAKLMSGRPSSSTRSRPVSAPSTRSLHNDSSFTLRTREMLRPPKPPTKDLDGEDIIYGYDAQTGRRFVQNKAREDELIRRRMLEKKEDVRNVSDLGNDAALIALQAQQQARALEPTRPSWPGRSTERSAMEWVNRMRLNHNLIAKEAPKSTPVMHAAYHQLEALDMVLSIEHCVRCVEHNVSLRHDESEYRTQADAFLQILSEAVYALKPAVRLGVSRFAAQVTADSTQMEADSRIGAFEVQVAFRPQGSGPLKLSVLHSKLTLMRWPSKAVLVKRLHSFLAKLNLSSFPAPSLECSINDMAVAWSGYTSTAEDRGVDKSIQYVQWLFDARSYHKNTVTVKPIAHDLPSERLKVCTSNSKPPSSELVSAEQIAEVTAQSELFTKCSEQEAEAEAEPLKQDEKSVQSLFEDSFFSAGFTELEVPANFQSMRVSLYSCELAGNALVDSDYDSFSCVISYGAAKRWTFGSEEAEARTDRRSFTNCTILNEAVSADDFRNLQAAFSLLNHKDDECTASSQFPLHSLHRPIGEDFEISLSVITCHGAVIAMLRGCTSECLNENVNSAQEEIMGAPQDSIYGGDFYEEEAKPKRCGESTARGEEEAAVVLRPVDESNKLAVPSSAKIPLNDVDSSPPGNGFASACLQGHVNFPDEDAVAAAQESVYSDDNYNEEEETTKWETTSGQDEKVAILCQYDEPTASTVHLSTEIPAQQADGDQFKPVSWAEALLRIKKIEARGLKNVESGEGKNDPYCELSFSEWRGRTSVLEGAGSNTVWRYAADNHSMSFKIQSSAIMHQSLYIAVYDANLVAANVCIGKAEIRLESLLSLHLHEVVEVQASLADDLGQETEIIVLSLALKDVLMEMANMLNLPLDLETSMEGSSALFLTSKPEAEEAPGDDDTEDQYEEEFEDEATYIDTLASSLKEEENEEKSALLNFFTSTGGEGWDIKPSWSRDQSLVQLSGVLANSSGTSVLEISLGRKALRGCIPQCINAFQSLTVLLLYSNKLEGCLPLELFSLFTLRKLNLYDNLLSGEISPLFSNLSCLELLNLSCNQFSGAPPPELSKMPLKCLYLHQNALKGPIPLALAHCTTLEDFSSDHIPYADFPKIPDWIVSSQRLNWEDSCGEPSITEQASLQGIGESYSESKRSQYDGWTNWCNSQVPIAMWRGLQLSKTGAIQSLVLRNCGLTGSLPTVLSSLDRLIYLDLSSNSIEGEVSATSIALKYLQFLHLDHNQFTSAFALAASASHLKTLDLSHNFIQETLPADTLKSLSSLENLRLGHNLIEGLLIGVSLQVFVI